nr:MAG TPA: hypothetical protein [Caudoviricetes sp.]
MRFCRFRFVIFLWFHYSTLFLIVKQKIEKLKNYFIYTLIVVIHIYIEICFFFFFLYI